MSSLESLNIKLAEAAKLLNEASAEIRDNDLNKGKNIRKIGESLVNIFEIQHEIYEIRPDLKPDFLND